MSALLNPGLNQSEQSIGFSNGFSKVSVNQQEIVKIFNQKSGIVMQGMCKFDDKFEILYPLFRGLSEAGKPQGLSMKFSAIDKAVYFHYPETSHYEVAQYFSNLIFLLQSEVKFKKVLKEIIINRNHFKSEQYLLQNAMMGSIEN